jgi:hypothetical protein
MDAPLPIDLLYDHSPLTFKWRHRVDTPIGSVVQECEGPLPSSVEGAVANLITLAHKLRRENKDLWARLEKTQQATAPKPVKAK